MGKTITIPRSRHDEEQGDKVGYHCEVYLDFKYDGEFDRDTGGDLFTGPLPIGHVTAGKHGPFWSPRKDLEVSWEYTASNPPLKAHGTIEVKEGNDCKDDVEPRE